MIAGYKNSDTPIVVAPVEPMNTSSLSHRRCMLKLDFERSRIGRQMQFRQYPSCSGSFND